jgi:hypothetical protein
MLPAHDAHRVFPTLALRPYSPKCLEWGFSEVPHSPDPMRQGFLCKDYEGGGHVYIRA